MRIPPTLLRLPAVLAVLLTSAAAGADEGGKAYLINEAQAPIQQCLNRFHIAISVLQYS